MALPVRTEPALFLTTQTTLPSLANSLFAFTLAAIGLVAQAGATASDGKPWPKFELLGVDSQTAALALLTIGALGFLLSAEFCIKSQAHDHLALGPERLHAFGIAPTAEQARFYVRQVKLWHARAVVAYHFGLGISLSGFALAMLPRSPAVFWIVAGFVACALLWLVGDLVVGHIGAQQAASAVRAAVPRADPKAPSALAGAASPSTSSTPPSYDAAPATPPTKNGKEGEST